MSRLCSSLFLFCVLGLCFALLPRGLRAQESPNPEEYTVIAGDTVSAIATKFGVSVDAITSVNGLVDPALIQIGQTLIIPAADGSLPISAIDVGMLHARPGESLHQIARRSGQEPSLIAALNNRSAESRLFPGEPVAVPAAAQIEPFRFGAITQIDYPAEIVQGQTALLTMQSRRAISLSISLGTQPLPVFSAAPHQYWTFLPVSALHTPQIILLQLRYFTASGLEVERSLPIEVRSGEYVHQNVWIPDEKFALLAPEVIDEEEQRLAPIWSTLTTPLNAAAGFRRPIAEQYITTSRFGDRRSYNDGFYTSYHSGQDFGAPQAVTVTVPATGHVAFAGELAIRGNAVVLDHGSGILTGYWHLSAIHVSEGQTVTPQESIGLVGTTGRSTGPHLHWELRVFGVAVDPMQFLGAPILPAGLTGTRE